MSATPEQFARACERTGSAPGACMVRARVVEAGRQAAWVVPLDEEGCPACARGAGCGLGPTHRRLGPAPRLRIATPSTLAPGELVWLATSRRALALTAAAVLGLPLAGFLLGAAAPALLLEYAPAARWEAGGVLGAALGLLAGAGAARPAGRWLGSRVSFQPQFVRKVVS